MGLIKTLILALIIFVGGLIAIGLYAQIDIQANKSIGISEEVVLSGEKLFTITNEWRVSVSKNPYQRSHALCELAERRLTTTTTDWSHNGFEYLSPLFYKENPEFTGLGENLVKGFMNEEFSHAGLLDSPSHRENLEADYSHLCIRCEDDRCVQIFGRMK